MSDVISAFTAGQEDFIIGTLGYFWGKTYPENTKNKEEGKEKRRAKKRKKCRGNSKWSLTFYYQAQSPEPGTHISKSCRRPNFLMKKSLPVCQFGFFPHVQTMKCKWCWGDLEGNLSHEGEAVENCRERYTEKCQDGPSHPWCGQEFM